MFAEEVSLHILPAGVRVRAPCPADTIELVVHGEVLESQLSEAVGHSDTGRARPDDDGIQLSCVFRHLEFLQAQLAQREMIKDVERESVEDALLETRARWVLYVGEDGLLPSHVFMEIGLLDVQTVSVRALEFQAS